MLVIDLAPCGNTHRAPTGNNNRLILKREFSAGHQPLPVSYGMSHVQGICIFSSRKCGAE